MAIDAKTLQRFLDNPAMFSAKDMGLEDEQEEVAPVSSEKEGIEVPEIDPESLLESSESEMEGEDLAMSDEEDLKELLTTLRDDINKENSEIKDKALIGGKELPQSKNTEMLRKLRAGESLDEFSDEDNQDIAKDMQAPSDLRKKAMQKIKQKYLGQ